MDAETRILIVEDEVALLETLVYNLEREGYRPIPVRDGAVALQRFEEADPDLILLDLMLPGLDGFELCRLLRQRTEVPILILTARGEEIDKVLGLELGADDYLTKPFSFRELLARIRAHLRRSRRLQGRGPAERLVFGDLTIDLRRREVRLGDRPLALRPKEFDLLAFLARNRGAVLSRDLILERVWGWEYDGGSRTVDVHIHWLREKIEADPAHPRRIVTVRGVGYRFEG